MYESIGSLKRGRTYAHASHGRLAMDTPFGMTYATVSEISKFMDATVVAISDDGWAVWICAMLLWPTIQALLCVARPRTDRQ
jgi:hypothetical protein